MNPGKPERIIEVEPLRLPQPLVQPRPAAPAPTPAPVRPEQVPVAP